MPDIGIVVGGHMNLIADLAQVAEQGGYESIWVAETANTPFVQAAVACTATSRVKVGTAIALAFPRSPTVTAATARDLQELSGGRFMLGLGSQVKRVNQQRFGVPFEHPAPKMAEYAQVVREVLATFDGEKVDHRGRFYEITMNPFPGASAVPEIPLYLAAVNRKMIETAGAAYDGVLGHPLTSPKYVAEVVRPAVERGATVAGRDPSAVSVSNNVIMQVNDDLDAARRQAAYQIAFYGTTRTYKPVLALHGFDDRVGDLRAAHAAGDLERMADIALPMVDTFAICGTVDACREQLEAFDGIVDRIILGGAWVGPDQGSIVENYRRILTEFRPGG
ncbi:MAG TPA: LLM class flavin-dependent oxidoreductase [Actinomycetota bacterium]|nr:LLM class flavin-dependent oxidoreductase [Actinomycetota bacterium]